MGHGIYTNVKCIDIRSVYEALSVSIIIIECSLLQGMTYRTIHSKDVCRLH